MANSGAVRQEGDKGPNALKDPLPSARLPLAKSYSQRELGQASIGNTLATRDSLGLGCVHTLF